MVLSAHILHNNFQHCRQLTGIGASGTFQLAEPFTPSPNILAGKDTASDYEEESSEEESSEEEDEEGYKQAKGGFDLAYFNTDAYVPRPSKRRGKGRKIAPVQKLQYEVTVPKQKAKKRQAAKKGRGRGGKKAKYADSSSEDSSSEEEDSSSEEEDSSSSEEEDSSSEEEVENDRSGEAYRPRPSASRGGGGRGRGRASPAKPAARGRGAAPKGRGAAAAKKGKGRAAPAKKGAQKGRRR